jgi:hypothetical protein
MAIGAMEKDSEESHWRKKTAQKGAKKLLKRLDCSSSVVCNHRLTARWRIKRGLTGYRRDWKQALQYTGLSFLGTNGILVGAPHCAQTVSYISRSPLRWLFLELRQSLQRAGSFWKPFSA